MDNEQYAANKLEDHELRIRKLEENDIQQRIQLTNIEKSQSDIKLMMSEQSKEQLKVNREQTQMLNDFTTETVRYFQKQATENINNKNTIKIQDRKEIWALVSLLIGGLLAYLGLK